MRVTISTPAVGGNLKDRKRIESMRRVQAAALDLFEAEGFAAVTIEQIAGAAGVGPATVYRHFGTKERVVLWDEYDPGLFEAVRERLSGASPLAAVRDALSAELGRVYGEDKERILRRARLMERTASLRALSASDSVRMREGLAELFRRTGACRDGLRADVTAGAIVAALEAAVAHWVAAGGRTRLERFIRRAFKELADL